MVISIANISPTHGSRYYLQEGLSTQPPSLWSGKLAPILGVEGEVEAVPFQHLLNGQDIDGNQLVVRVQVDEGRNKTLKNAGIDLTFSPPKSVSLQALVFEDPRLKVAHQWAARVALQTLEERYSLTRVQTAGKRHNQITGQVLIAQFNHITSRELDPQLHTHNIILNLQLFEGKWRSLDNRGIYKARMLLDLIYRNELAREVQKLGYHITISNPKYGLWELEGYSSKQIEQFSKRAYSIRAVVGDEASARARAWAAVASGRKKKQQISEDELHSSWQEEADQSGIHPSQQDKPSNPSLQKEAQRAKELIEQAVTAGSNHTREDVEAFVLRHPGAVSYTALQPLINEEHYGNLARATEKSGDILATSRSTARPTQCAEYHTGPGSRGYFTALANRYRSLWEPAPGGGSGGTPRTENYFEGDHHTPGRPPASPQVSNRLNQTGASVFPGDDPTNRGKAASDRQPTPSPDEPEHSR